MPDYLSHIVQAAEAGQRLRKLIREIFPQILSAQGARKAIRSGQVTLDGARASSDTRVQAGQSIRYVPQLVSLPPAPSLRLPVLFEDEYLAVVSKPPGIEVSSPNQKALAPSLSHFLTQSKQPDALPAPWPVHRLDHGTSGALIIAKCYSAQKRLGQAFAKREIHKTYEALVVGIPPTSSRLDSPLDDKIALTRFERLALIPAVRQGYIAHLRLWPETGRKHQIRRHLADAGWPILGDQLYSPPGAAMRGRGLFLAATALQFAHPADGRMIMIEAALPRKFGRLWEREQALWARHQSRLGPAG